MRIPPAVYLLVPLLLSAPLVAADAPLRWSDASAAVSVDEMERTAYAWLHEQEQPAKAYPWYRAAAVQGSAAASANLGWLYEEGLGVEQDGAAATYWYGRAVEAGAARYTLHLGWMHLDGKLLEVDREQAEDWFRTGMDLGVREAALALGSVYFADVLGGRSELGPEAEALLLQALEQGVAQAAGFLARMYLDGLGIEADVERGLAAARLGAATGDTHMQQLLIRLYLEGGIVEADPVQANVWATVAARQGDTSARAISQELEARVLSDEDTQRSREQARVILEG